MTRQTWGLHIPGYSSPSSAQENLFTRLHPETVAWYRMERDRIERVERQRTNDIRSRYMASKLGDVVDVPEELT